MIQRMKRQTKKRHSARRSYYSRTGWRGLSLTMRWRPELRAFA